MAHVLSVVAFEHSSGLPEDRSINTFHWSTLDASPDTGDLDEIDDALVAFYTASIDGETLVQFMSRELDGDWSITYYNMDEPEPRVPLRTDNHASTFPSTDNALPEEVALVLSFHAPYVSGTPNARRRGRIYLGPLNGTANTIDGRPHADLIARLAAGGDAMASLIVPDAQWVVYSPTDDDIHLVTAGWVDNAFDTQRRRGQAATSRTTWAT